MKYVIRVTCSQLQLILMHRYKYNCDVSIELFHVEQYLQSCSSSSINTNLLFVANEIDNSLPRLARPGLAHTKPIGSNWKVWSMQQPAASWHAVIWTATQYYSRSASAEFYEPAIRLIPDRGLFKILICTLYLCANCVDIVCNLSGDHEWDPGMLPLRAARLYSGQSLLPWGCWLCPGRQKCGISG